jgi:hypothetical protein
MINTIKDIMEFPFSQASNQWSDLSL